MNRYIKLRGYEFEEVVEWESLIEDMRDSSNS